LRLERKAAPFIAWSVEREASLCSGVARVWAARAALEFGAPEAHKNTYCTVTGS